MKRLKISFCIVCMNRLHQLKETFPKNITDNTSYPNIEFVLLDYNSKDGMGEWVHKNMNHYIKNGLVTYYHTTTPKVFNHSHSKNMAFKLATGDIVCNVNADHFTGKDFANYVNELYNRANDIVITPVDFFKKKPNYKLPSDVMGKVCVKKSDFYKVTGFDEKMGAYGFEDYDFINRLELAGLKLSFIENREFLKFINHDNNERYSLNSLINNIYAFYIQYKTPVESKILLLYKNRQFECGTLIDNFSLKSGDPESAYLQSDSLYEFNRKETKWEQGVWDEDDNHFYLPEGELRKSKTDELDVLHATNDAEAYWHITDGAIIEDIINFKFTYTSRSVMEQNLKNKKIIVNKSFGNGMVYKNFNAEQPIYI